MRTVLVNPSRYAKRGRRKSSNPRKPANVRVIVVRGARRRNAAMPPVVMAANPSRRRRRSNPAPRRVVIRRRYRRNPFDFKFIGMELIKSFGAAVGSYFLNKSVISTLGTDAQNRDTQYGMVVRNLVRVALSALGTAWVGGTMAAAWAGSMMYPAVFELDNWWRRQGTSATAASSTANRYKTEEELALGAGSGAGSTKELSAALEAELDAALNNYDMAY